MDNDQQFERVYITLESIQAQLRSLTASLAANTSYVTAELTGLRVWKEGHEDQTKTRKDYVDEAITELSQGQGALRAELINTISPIKTDVTALQKIHEQAKGAALAWRLILGGFGAILLILNVWHLASGSLK